MKSKSDTADNGAAMVIENAIGDVPISLMRLNIIVLISICAGVVLWSLKVRFSDTVEIIGGIDSVDAGRGRLLMSVNSFDEIGTIRPGQKTFTSFLDYNDNPGKELEGQIMATSAVPYSLRPGIIIIQLDAGQQDSIGVAVSKSKGTRLRSLVTLGKVSMFRKIFESVTNRYNDYSKRAKK